MIAKKERERLLALDRRFPRMPSDPSHRERQRQAQMDKIRQRFQLQAALRDLLAIHDSPSEAKWDYAAVRRLDKIRALARIV